MITEDYVSFETAKLLKEKGFDSSCEHQYINCSSGYPFLTDIRDDAGCYYKNSEIGQDEYSAPTLQMVMKWLRENHKLHIQIWILEDKGYWFDIEKILNAQYKHKSLYSTGLEDIYFETYEQACENAIKYCLENLI